MAIKYYTLPELKQLALDSANTIGTATEYDYLQVEKAYAYACARCGYENPADTDTDYYVKQRWLVEMMSLFFYYDIQNKYLLKFTLGDLRLGDVSKVVRDIIKAKEDGFIYASTKDTSSMHLLSGSSSSTFGTLVYSNGLVDDIMGQPMTTEDVEELE